MKGPMVVAANTMLFCLSLMAAVAVMHSTYIMFALHDGFCFSYQCTPNVFTNIPMVLMALVLVGLNFLLMYKASTNIMKEFKR